MLTLAGKRALVTGGSRGIGRAIALLFGRLGARVAVHYASDEAAARHVVETLGPGNGIALRADLSEPETASGLVEGAAAALGGLDVVVVNHGIWKRGPLESLSLDQWDETLRTNLTGPYRVCREAARQMVPHRSGAVVLISSTAGQRGEAYYSHYAASKGGIIAFTKSLAAELAPQGIRVNCVAPGWVLTDMSRHVFEGPEAEAALRRIPTGRPGTPEEIAGPVAFLASDLASYVWGEVLCVNGGAVMVG
jgi:3-oxoacyl-[acyl-carrier protein] reductase